MNWLKMVLIILDRLPSKLGIVDLQVRSGGDNTC